MNLVEVCTAENEINAFLIKGFLESRGIECSIYAIPGPRGIVSLGKGLLPHTIKVEEERAEEARKVLNEREK